MPDRVRVGSGGALRPPLGNGLLLRVLAGGARRPDIAVAAVTTSGRR
jgi:hypothetical protein